jgi:hypothetical protein
MVLIGLVAVAIALGFGGWLAIGHTPQFYRRALVGDPASQAAASTEMFNRAQRLARDVKERNTWQAQFTTEQINGYLAVDLVKQFPELNTPEIRDPRVDLRPGEATLAFQYAGSPVTSVVSLDVDVYLHEPNVVAIRIRGARAGALPLPLSDVLDAVSRAAEAAEVPLRWRQSDGDPVALVTFKAQPGRPQLVIDKLEISDGVLEIAGRTGGVGK